MVFGIDLIDEVRVLVGRMALEDWDLELSLDTSDEVTLCGIPALSVAVFLSPSRPSVEGP